MQTLTYFIEDLYLEKELTLGEEAYQTFENKAVNSVTYEGVTISGSKLSEMVYEDVIFDNCTFFGSSIENCIFINCLFINCKFQFSKFTDCNFESTSWENCMWGLSSMKDSEITSSDHKDNKSYESQGTGSHTITCLAEFLTLSESASV
ncbi:MAG: pentapeptide repeat-containing protein [Rhizobacter sp.]|nr:pentapeptide repeat-containing protein [Bacteriovorax sp.]